MAAPGDADGSHGGCRNPSGCGGDDNTSPPLLPTTPASPAHKVLTDENTVGSPAFPHCQYCAACPLAQHPATPVQYLMPPLCQCQTDHWVAIAIARYSDNFFRLLSRNDVLRALASFFSFLTVVFVLASRGLDVPACRYLFSTGIIAHLYSLAHLSESIWQTAVRGYLPNLLSDVSCYAPFTCDLVFAYLLLSSSSVAVLGVNNVSWYYYDYDKGLARCSVAWSFATFFFTAISSVFSGYKLYQRSILASASSAGNELHEPNKSAVEIPAAPVAAGVPDAGVASPACGVKGADAPAPTALTVGHVWGLPPSAAALLQYPAETLSSCQLRTNYSSTDLAKVLHLLKRNHVPRSLATLFSFYTVAFVLGWRMLYVAAFRYLFSTGIIALAYSAIRLTEGPWQTAMKAPISLPDSVYYYVTFILDLVLSYLLVSSSSVAVLGLDDIRGRTRTPACFSIVWSFASFLFIAISSILSGYRLCKTITGPSSSNEFDDANKSKPWNDPLLAA